MTPQEKIEYVRQNIADVAQISPSGFIHLKLYTVGHPDNPDEWTICTVADQKRILLKLQEEREIHGVEWDGDRGVWLAVGAPPKTFEEAMLEYDEEYKHVGLETKYGTLQLNAETGFASLNKVTCELNPSSKEFKILKMLMESKNHQATYAELLGGNPSKPNRRLLTFSIRTLKQGLGILPTIKRNNKDIFENIKGFGYRLKIKPPSEKKLSQ